MSKEELAAYLREYLTLEVEYTSDGCSCCEQGPSIHIKLKLSGETISEDWFDLPDCNH